METTAEVICDSIGPNGIRITTLLLVYPRIIHAEHLRHRNQSFSVASSRAIPCEKQIEQVKNDPFVPIGFQKNHKGMQGTEYFEGTELDVITKKWLQTANSSVEFAEYLKTEDLTKQLINRVIEPFVYTRVVCTATEWKNFFSLRIHDAAEIHIKDLAVKIKDAMDKSVPRELDAFNWHLPFIEWEEIYYIQELRVQGTISSKEAENMAVNISAARCARTSYGKNIGKTLEEELRLAKGLLEGRHLSPFEHQAMTLPSYRQDGWSEVGVLYDLVDKYPGLELRYSKHKYEIWSGNLKGCLQYRKTITNESGEDL